VVRIYVPRRADCDLVTNDARFIDWFIGYNSDDGRIEFTDSADASDIVVLFEQYSYKTWRYAEELARSPLVRDHAERIYCVNYDSVGRGFLPGCYTSLTRANYDPSLHRACGYPKDYNEIALAPQGASPPIPTFLFSFVGTTRSFPLRRKIVELLGSHPMGRISDLDVRFHSHTEEQKRSYVRSIQDSWFVLCPRGSSPSSYRLFETMALGRCPVILSDDWIPVHGVDWGDCSIRIPEADLAEVPRILGERLEGAELLGRNARETFRRFFTHPMRYRQYLQGILELHSAVDDKPKDYDSRRKRWRSAEFRRANQWTLPQRARRRAARALLRTG